MLPAKQHQRRERAVSGLRIPIKGRQENENGRRVSEEGTLNIEMEIKVLRPECQYRFKSPERR